MQPHRATALNDSFHVLIRFGIRLAILIALAFVVQIGFAQAFPRLLLLAGLFCSLWAIVRREAMFGPVLTHWDEAAALIIMSRLAAVITWWSSSALSPNPVAAGVFFRTYENKRCSLSGGAFISSEYLARASVIMTRAPRTTIRGERGGAGDAHLSMPGSVDSCAPPHAPHPRSVRICA